MTEGGGTGPGDTGPPVGGTWPASEHGWTSPDRPSIERAAIDGVEPATEPLSVEPGATATGVTGSGAMLGERAISVNADDARLLRRTRVRLVIWSGGITLAVLVLLGVTLFAAVRTSLEGDSIAQLRERADIAARILGQLPSDVG